VVGARAVSAGRVHEPFEVLAPASERAPLPQQTLGDWLLQLGRVRLARLSAEPLHMREEVRRRLGTIDHNFGMDVPVAIGDHQHPPSGIAPRRLGREEPRRRELGERDVGRRSAKVQTHAPVIPGEDDPFLEPPFEQGGALRVDRRAG